MPVFLYKAYDRAGKISSGRINASSRLEAVESLKSKLLFPASVVLETQEESFQFFSFLGGVDKKVVLAFTRQLAVLLKSGIQLLQAINLILEQEQSAFKKVLFQVRDSLKEGKSFADSLDGHKTIFDAIYIQLVRAGEASGKLDKVLFDVANDIEKSIRLQKEVSGALRGPLWMILGIVLVLFGVVYFILPQISTMIKEMGGQLPWITEFLLGSKDFITTNWLIMIVAIFIFGVSFFKIARSNFVSLLTDRLLIKTPIVSTFYKTRAVVQFCQTLGMLLSAGVHLPQALEIVCQVISNNTLKQTLLDAKENIVKEGKIATYLEKTNIFPPIAFYMIKIGEESGELPSMLLRVASDYEVEMTEKTKLLVGAINPIMYVIMGGMIMVLAYAIIGPISELGNISTGF